MATELIQTLRDLVEPTVQRLGFDLVAVEILPGPRGQIVRMSIEGPEGIGADDCAHVSHQLGPLLDADDPMPGSYTLEVSSPGIERPVQRRDDFRRFVGYRARLRLHPGPARRRYTGTLQGLEDDDVLVEVDGVTHPLAHESIEACHLVLSLDDYAALADGPPPLPAADDASAPQDLEEG